MDNARKCALNVIEQIINQNAYSNIALSIQLNKSDLSDKDKALVTEIVYGTLKYKYTIDKILSHFLKKGLKSLSTKALNILRMGIYQIRYLDKIPEFAAVNESVELCKRYSPRESGVVNGVLRNYLRNKEYLFYNQANKIETLCFEYSFEKWMVELFISQYGYETTKKMLNGLNMSPSITVRVNSLKANYEEVWNKLLEIGYDIEQGKVCPEAILIKRGKSIENNPLFKEGLFTVQDESAMLVAKCMDIKNNMKVVDLCSAPGGKATHISEILNNTGEVLAFDIHENKLNLIANNMIRLGIHNMHLEALDASVINNKLIEYADRVLIDVPCSGLGIIRKKPEIKWTKNMNELKSIISIQRKIMDCAANYLKKNGMLIYSTCTLNKYENEDNIEWFLGKHPNFKLIPLDFGNMDNIVYDTKGFVTVIPDKNMDGFFIAKLIKQW